MDATKEITIEQLYRAMMEGFSTIRGALLRIDERLDRLEKWVGALEERVGALEKRMDRLEKRMNELEKRVDQLDQEIGRLQKELKHHIKVSHDEHDEIQRSIQDYMLDENGKTKARLESHGRRLRTIEKFVFQ